MILVHSSNCRVTGLPGFLNTHAGGSWLAVPAAWGSLPTACHAAALGVTLQTVVSAEKIFESRVVSVCRDEEWSQVQ